MTLLQYLTITAFCLLLIAFVFILATNRKYTKGLWKTYIGWLVISGVLMSVYLFASVLSKTALASKYAHIIIIIGFVSEAIASITYIKSSNVLNSMAKRLGFAKEMSVEETLKLKARPKK